MALERTDLLDQAPVPFGKREVRYPSPNIADLTVIEVIPISPESYKKLPYGSPHPDYANNGLILVWQGPVKAGNNQVKVVRVYSTRDINQDWYNYAIHFGGDLAAVPIFIRSYVTLRTDFVPAARGQPFKGIYKLVLTVEGTGYTAGDAPPAVVFTGGGGSGAAANAIMDETGTKVIGFELTDEGDNYTGNAALSCTGGSGSGVTGTAYVQPPAAVLVKEETAKLDSEDPQLASLFIKVNRIYETLPGAVLTWDSYADERGAVQRTSQPILAVGSEVAAFTRPTTGQARKTWFEPRGDSAVVLNKIIEDWTEVIINDQEVTSEFGGGILDATERRDAPGAQTPDEGLGVTASKTETVSPAEQIKKTKKLKEKTTPWVLLGSGGINFTSAPAVSFTGGTGPGGAVGVATIGFKVASVGGGGGTGYLVPPLVRWDGDGYGLRILANITAGAISSFTILDPGFGFSVAPTLTIVPRGSGTGGTATATLQTTGEVIDVQLTTPGDYSVAPTIVFTGGGGSGASATYKLASVEWPELIGNDTDPRYGIVVNLSKKVIPGGTRYPGVPVSLSGPYIDINTHDRWRSIQIVSKVDLRTLPKPLVWGTYHHLDLPSTLTDVTASWDRSGGETAAARQTRGFTTGGGPGISGGAQVTAAGGTLLLLSSGDAGLLADVAVSVNNGVMGAIEILFNHGYRGPAQAIVSREFFFGPPTLEQIAAVTKIIPVTGSASLIGKHTSFHKSLGTGPAVSLGTDGHLQTRSLTFGPFLSGAVVSNQQTFSAFTSSADAQAGPDLDGESYEATFVLPGAEGTLNVNIPVSIPASLPSGTWICVDAPVEEWRFGLFVLHTIFAKVP
jgi:hypothetical protein